MRTTPDLTLLTVDSKIAVDELNAVVSDSPRGGPDWDPFRGYPEVRLGSRAQQQLLAVLREAKELSTEADRALTRARTDRSRRTHSQRAYKLNDVAAWAQEALLASVSLLLVRRVDMALKRHHRSASENGEEYMAEALACTMGCLETCPAEARFHLYVASSVDATLSLKALEGSVAETMPSAWQVAMRHIPSIISEQQEALGRDPSDDEIGQALLTRARSWAEARIVEKGGDVEADILKDLVDAKLTKQGMFSAAKHIGDIRAALKGTISIDEVESGDAMLATHSAPSAENVVDDSDLQCQLRALFAPMPFVSDDLEVAPQDADRARELLESSLWHTLATTGGIPVESAHVSRKAPDILARVTA